MSTLPASAIDVRELIAAADAALYEAKRTGKDRVVVAEAGQEAPSGSQNGPADRSAKGPAPARRK